MGLLSILSFPTMCVFNNKSPMTAKFLTDEQYRSSVAYLIKKEQMDAHRRKSGVKPHKNALATEKILNLMLEKPEFFKAPNTDTKKS